MQRPRPSFWIATATVAALALGGGVAAARDGQASIDAPARHSQSEDVQPDDTGSTSTSTTPSTSTPTVPVVVPPTAPSGSDDDPATHDVGDDHGGDDGSHRGPGGGDDSGHDDSGHGGSGPG